MQRAVRLFLLVVLWFVSSGQLDWQAGARQLAVDPIAVDFSGDSRVYLSTLITQADLIMVGQINYITDHYYTDATDQPLLLSEIEVTPLEMLKGRTPLTTTMLLRAVTATAGRRPPLIFITRRITTIFRPTIGIRKMANCWVTVGYLRPIWLLIHG